MSANVTPAAGHRDDTPAPKRQILTTNTYEAVKARLMDHVIPPDARISIDGLARELGVSPTPVRETLARLESDGLVVREALRGYQATPLLSRRELDELYDFRLLIEPWAAAEAARQSGPAERSRVIDEMASCPDVPAGSDYDAYHAIAAHDARFHDLILELSGNRRVRAAFQHTHCHLHIFRLYYASRIGTSALAEHREITRAIAAADADAARAGMRDHLIASRDRLIAVYA